MEIEKSYNPFSEFGFELKLSEKDWEILYKKQKESIRKISLMDMLKLRAPCIGHHHHNTKEWWRNLWIGIESE